jgi:hypothetical protein
MLRWNRDRRFAGATVWAIGQQVELAWLDPLAGCVLWREFPAVASSSTEAEGTEALFLKGASACLKPRENP